MPACQYRGSRSGGPEGRQQGGWICGRRHPLNLLDQPRHSSRCRAPCRVQADAIKSGREPQPRSQLLVKPTLIHSLRAACGDEQGKVAGESSLRGGIPAVPIGEPVCSERDRWRRRDVGVIVHGSGLAGWASATRTATDVFFVGVQPSRRRGRSGELVRGRWSGWWGNLQLGINPVQRLTPDLSLPFVINR
jgi:hypothetical protein